MKTPTHASHRSWSKLLFLLLLLLLIRQSLKYSNSMSVSVLKSRFAKDLYREKFLREIPEGKRGWRFVSKGCQRSPSFPTYHYYNSGTPPGPSSRLLKFLVWYSGYTVHIHAVYNKYGLQNKNEIRFPQSALSRAPQRTPTSGRAEWTPNHYSAGEVGKPSKGSEQRG